MANITLVQKGRFRFTLRHLAIISVLVAAFAISFAIRAQPLDYGYELNEFDPFFNYRAAQYMVNNGLPAYMDWFDYQSWYPRGRNISDSSQIMLHLTAASTYYLFGGNTTFYDYTVIFPVIFSSLTAVAMFALVRVVGGTTAGLFAAMMFSMSVPIIVRGTAGWFKSEPLGLFYGVLGLYMFVSGLKSGNHKVALAKLLGAGVIFSCGLASWGGDQFFVLFVTAFFIALPFLRSDSKFQLWALPAFTASLLLTVLLFPRPGVDFVTGFGGLLLIASTAFAVVCNVLRIIRPAHALRNCLLLLVGTLVSAPAIITLVFHYGLVDMPKFRYIAALNPFLSSADPLLESIAEHATTTLSASFYFHSILMLFAGIAVWLLLRGKHGGFKRGNDMLAFALLMGMLGVYISSAFIRLEVFGSIGIIILASIGLSLLFKRMYASKDIMGRKSNLVIKSAFTVGIFAMLSVPLVVPAEGNWINSIKTPATILNGGSMYPVVTDDWTATLEWLEANTPEGSIVAAWWDYGYWITAGSNRTTLADNATMDNGKIQNIAKLLIGTPDESLRALRSFDADYVLVFVVAQQIQSNYHVPLYYLGSGGDESKKGWIIRIAKEPESKYLESDFFSGTDYFWEKTTLGQMFPYQPVAYYDERTGLDFDSYQPGTAGLYVKQVKYPSDDHSGPFRLVYASPSYMNDSTLSLGVFVYEVNKNYPLPQDWAQEQLSADAGIGAPVAEAKETKTAVEAAATALTAFKVTNAPAASDPTAAEDDAAPAPVDGEDAAPVDGEDAAPAPVDGEDAAPAPVDGEDAATATLETALGSITIEFFDDVAPNHVKNFKDLSDSGFYNGTVFHRIVPGFVIQGGDPNTVAGDRVTWGTGDPGYLIQPEFNSRQHEKYAVSMARSHAADSAGSQFFIVLEDSPFLDGQYTVFGRVVSGFDTVDGIAALDTNEMDQPVNADDARVSRIVINHP